MSKNTYPEIPLLPLRGILIYPTMVLHIDVGRERSVFAIERALDNDGFIFLATQKDTGLEDPERDDIYDMGTLATVKSIKELENGTFRVLI